MNISQILAQAQQGQGLGGLAKMLGIDEARVAAIAGQLGPMLAGAAKKKITGGDPETVLSALQGEGSARYLDDPVEAAGAASEGEAFLNNMFGSSDATTAVKQRVAEKAGVDLSDVMKALPSLAAMAQGGMQRQMPDREIEAMRAGVAQGGGGGLLGGILGAVMGGGKTDNQGGGAADMLTSMFDEDGDGSAIDDILGKFMK